MQANGNQSEYRGVLPARQAPTTFTTKLARFARRAGSYDDRSNLRKLIYKPVWVAPCFCRSPPRGRLEYI